MVASESYVSSFLSFFLLFINVDLVIHIGLNVKKTVVTSSGGGSIVVCCVVLPRDMWIYTLVQNQKPKCHTLNSIF